MAADRKPTETEVSFEPVQTIPRQPAGRRSASLAAYEAAQSSPTKKVVARFENETDADRFYRSMLQWMRRNPQLEVDAVRVVEAVYIWVPSANVPRMHTLSTLRAEEARMALHHEDRGLSQAAETSRELTNSKSRERGTRTK